METITTPQFDPAKYKQSTFEQWQSAADAWYRWSALLNQWLGAATEIMLQMAHVSEGKNVLDVAAGAGEQSVTAAKKVGSTGHVLATDISPNILAYARKLAKESGVQNIETRVMDGEQLDLPDATFDAVISRVGLIYFPDQQKALREMLRVLKPGGMIAAIVYSTPDKNTFFSIPVSIIRNWAKLPPPAPGQPGPFSLGGPGVIEKAFEQAGFRNVQSVLVNSPVILPSAKFCVEFERESFGALHQMMSGLSDEEKQTVWSDIEKELSKFENENGFSGPCEMIVAVGTK
jgi:ubiquinone/menaquinone biosynthesis C-methylase UbiE